MHFYLFYYIYSDACKVVWISSDESIIYVVDKYEYNISIIFFHIYLGRTRLFIIFFYLFYLTLAKGNRPSSLRLRGISHVLYSFIFIFYIYFTWLAKGIGGTLVIATTCGLVVTSTNPADPNVRNKIDPHGNHFFQRTSFHLPKGKHVIDETNFCCLCQVQV